MSGENVNLNNAMAKNSGDIIYGTGQFTPTIGKSYNPNSPRWQAFVAGPAGCTVSAMTCTLTNINQLISTALPAGFVILDPSITAITLSAGTGIAYYA